MKRFTETTKWEDPWFRALPPNEKLLFLFLVENCNNAGFYELDTPAVAFKTGLTVEQVEGALKGLTRGIQGASGWVWVRRFLKHQKNDELNLDNTAHRQIVRLLKEQLERFSGSPEFGEFVAPYKPLLKGLPSPIGIGKGKGKGSAEGGNIGPLRPTLEEAIAFGAEISMSRERVESWFDHFQSNGWKVSGRAPMKDWKAALRNGNRRAFPDSPPLDRAKQKPLKMIS